MILNKTALSLAQVKEYTKNVDESKPIALYLKKFCKISKADADNLAVDIRALNNPKIKEENIIKILDMLPHDAEDMNKIFLEVSLTEEELKIILTLIKNISQKGGES